MAKVYCDHNFLINVFSESKAYKERLWEVVEREAVEFVLSTWHWVEMAKDENLMRGLELADFADSLKPIWLRDRRRIQADEVAKGLFAFMKLQYTPAPPISTLAKVFSEATEQNEGITVRYKQSRTFVKYLQTPEGAGRSHTPTVRISIPRNFLEMPDIAPSTSISLHVPCGTR